MPHRKDVTKDLNHDQHVELRDKIKDFLNATQSSNEDNDILHEHMAIVGSRDNPAGRNFPEVLSRAFYTTRDAHENLWHGHRFYISKLEDFLMANGGEQYVPLPKWDADQKIPPPLSYINPASDPLHRPQQTPLAVDAYNADPPPGVGAVAGLIGSVTGTSVPTTNRPQVPDRLKDDKIGEFHTAIAMAADITPYHFEVHFKLGGVMMNPHLASSCALFWVWHAALEDFYHKWQLRKFDRSKSLIVGQNVDGRLETFLIANQNDVWHSWQWARYGGWSYWQSLGGSAKQIVVVRSADGRLEIFAVGLDFKVMHKWQRSPQTDPWTEGEWSDWTGLRDQMAVKIAAAENADGRLEVFAIDLNGKLTHIWQESPNNGWSNWESLDPSKDVTDIAVGKHSSGILEVFALARDRTVWCTYQTGPDRGPWSAWEQVGDSQDTFLKLVTARSVSGRLLIFGVAAGDANSAFRLRYRLHKIRVGPRSFSGLVHRAREAFRGVAMALGFTFPFRAATWAELKDGKGKTIAVAERTDGRLQVCAIGMDNRLMSIAQEEDADDSWGEWNRSMGGDTGSNHPMELDEIAVARNDRSDPPSIRFGRLPEGTVAVFAKVRNEATWHKWQKDGNWDRWQLF